MRHDERRVPSARVELIAGGDFEDTRAGSLPHGWRLADDRAATVFTTGDHALGGHRSVALVLRRNCFPPAEPAVLTYPLAVRKLPREVTLRLRSAGSAEAVVAIEIMTPLGPQADWMRLRASFSENVRLPGAQSAVLVLRVFGAKDARLMIDDVSIQAVP